METAWWCGLDKKRGSRPRCVLLADGLRSDVAARLTRLVNRPGVTVTENDFWMPHGKPVWTDDGWNKKPADEARLDRHDGFLALKTREVLGDWWLEVKRGANTPNWDLAATCEIEEQKGLLLVEAKAHSSELSEAGKQAPTSENGSKNHERIGKAIDQAKIGLGRVGGSWGLSRDHHYQLANRFAWSWKLARLEVPVVLVYLGFLNAREMAKDGALFRSEDDWSSAMRDHARGVVDESCWEHRLIVKGTPFIPLLRAMEVPFAREMR